MPEVLTGPAAPACRGPTSRSAPERSLLHLPAERDALPVPVVHDLAGRLALRPQVAELRVDAGRAVVASRHLRLTPEPDVAPTGTQRDRVAARVLAARALARVHREAENGR